METTKKRKLSPRQLQFVNEYLLDLNGTQAALRAGYSEKTARNIAGNLLSKVNIRAAIVDGKQARIERTKVDADWLLLELQKLYGVSVSDFMVFPEDRSKQPYFDLSQASREQLAGLDEIQIDTIGTGENSIVDRVKVKLSPRLKILEIIGRHIDVHAFKDHLEVGLKKAGVENLTREELLEIAQAKQP